MLIYYININKSQNAPYNELNKFIRHSETQIVYVPETIYAL